MEIKIPLFDTKVHFWKQKLTQIEIRLKKKQNKNSFGKDKKILKPLWNTEIFIHFSLSGKKIIYRVSTWGKMFEDLKLCFRTSNLPHLTSRGKSFTFRQVSLHDSLESSKLKNLNLLWRSFSCFFSSSQRSKQFRQYGCPHGNSVKLRINKWQIKHW